MSHGRADKTPDAVWLVQPDCPRPPDDGARKKLVERAVKEFAKGVKPAKGRPPVLAVLLGPPGSGKSSVARRLYPGAVHIELDRVFEKFAAPDDHMLTEPVPGEFTQVPRVRMKGYWSQCVGLYWIDEAADEISRRAIANALKNRYDVAFESGRDFARFGREFRDAGYRLEVAAVIADLPTTIERAIARARAGGRFFGGTAFDTAAAVRDRWHEEAGALPMRAAAADALVLVENTGESPEAAKVTRVEAGPDGRRPSYETLAAAVKQVYGPLREAMKGKCLRFEDVDGRVRVNVARKRRGPCPLDAE